MRGDGIPTYNFGVVVDDIDMAITHVIRGDDHVNNTPRQINVYQALGAALPKFVHLPMILGSDGERLSKRHGAVSVTQYRDDGYLPEAVVNYLARLGWSHGDDEMFPREKLVEWFDLEHISKSPARFDSEKLTWLNQQYMKAADDGRLAQLTAPALKASGASIEQGPPLEAVVALLKDRVATIPRLAEAAMLFYADPGEQVAPADLASALAALNARLESAPWDRKSLGAAVSAVLKEHNLKMPQLAMPLRRLLTGREQTPSLDAVLELLGRKTVLTRLARALERR
jgi:glutamyl-tRNA synthetase